MTDETETTPSENGDYEPSGDEAVVQPEAASDDEANAELEADQPEEVDPLDDEFASEFKLPYTMPNVERLEIIPKEDRTTSNMLTRYEFARIIGTRAQQIENGGTIYCNPGHLTDPIKIAELELLTGRCPFIVRRVRGEHNKTYAEEFKLNEPNELMLPMFMLNPAELLTIPVGITAGSKFSSSSGEALRTEPTVPNLPRNFTTDDTKK